MTDRVLLVGGGGREHALAWALRGSADVIVAPGNGGLPPAMCRDVADTDLDGLVALALRERVDLAVIGPEAPLVAGLADRLAAVGVAVFGPSQAAAQLEGSKAFAKKLCDALDVPTAAYRVATTMADAEAAFAAFGTPVVVKADGLCAGKGVTVAATLDEARAAAHAALVDRVFGDAGATLVIERCLAGAECSVMAICNGTHARLLPPVRDHKRLRDGDRGPNTGGMGTYTPLPDVDAALLDDIKARIIIPVLRGMAERGTPFRGVLYAGLMLTDDGPQVIEFNVRFGDPETQAIVPLIAEDLLGLLRDAATSGLRSDTSVRVKTGAAVCVVLASENYPAASRTGLPISGLPDPAPASGLGGVVADRNAQDDALVFHAATRREASGALVTTGGRVLGVVGQGATHDHARARAYAAAERIRFAGRQMRRDIGLQTPALAAVS